LFRPQLEALEDRLPLNTAWMSSPEAPMARTSPAATNQNFDITGDASGTWTSTRNADGSTTQTLTGTGAVNAMGSVNLSGTLTTDPSTGVTRGTLTLSNSQGSVTLVLSGGAPRPGSSSTANYQYKITGGTGIYQGATGIGRVGLQETAQGGMTLHITANVR